MLTCKKTTYDTSKEKEYISRFNIHQDIKSINHLVDNLTIPEVRKNYTPKDNIKQWIKDKHFKFSKEWSKQIVRKTLLYIFYNSTSSMFVSIRNKTPNVYIIYNPELNNIKDKILFPCKIPAWIRVKKTGCLINFDIKKQESKDVKPFVCNGKQIVDTEWYKQQTYTPIFYYDEFSKFLTYLCKHRDIPDMDFVINYKDQLIVPSKYQVENILPIYSNCTADDYNDVPIVTPDELIQIFNIHSISRNCENPFKGLITPAWKNRRATLVFRGSATGCGNDIGTNSRFRVAALDAKWCKDNKYNDKNSVDGVRYLDAGIVSWGTRRMKITRGTNKANYPNIIKLSKEYGIKLKKFMTLQEQRQYKYVLYIEGNVYAYRLAYLFSTKSVVFYVKSDYKPWFYDNLKHMENCIMIENDYSNLADMITWCKTNDKGAYKIAVNGYILYKDTIGKKDVVLDYMTELLCYK